MAGGLGLHQVSEGRWSVELDFDTVGSLENAVRGHSVCVTETIGGVSLKSWTQRFYVVGMHSWSQTTANEFLAACCPFGNLESVAVDGEFLDAGTHKAGTRFLATVRVPLDMPAGGDGLTADEFGYSLLHKHRSAIRKAAGYGRLKFIFPGDCEPIEYLGVSVSPQIVSDADQAALIAEAAGILDRCGVVWDIVPARAAA